MDRRTLAARNQAGKLTLRLSRKSLKGEAPMSHSSRMRFALITIIAVITLSGLKAFTQNDAPPVNDLPNPYRTVENWAKMPEGRKWGATSAVEIDLDGKSIWVAERCGENTCVG